jgi:spore coat protein JC
MIGAIIRQLTRNLSAQELEAAGYAPYYVDHTAGVWPQAAGGTPFTSAEFQSTGDAITDLFEDMAADAAMA